MHDPKHLSLMGAIIGAASPALGAVQAAERALEIHEASEEAAAVAAGLHRDWERLEIAAEALLETYPEGHEDAGAYMVAFESIELIARFDELAKALEPFQLFKGQFIKGAPLKGQA